MNSNQQQNYANHRQLVPVVHFFMMPLSLIVFIASLVYIFRSNSGGEPLLPSLIIAALSLIVMVLVPVSRSFGTKMQDRIIRTEEDLRHYKLTGQWIDPQLTLKQIIALRFASDGEFPALCRRAVQERMKPDEIKRAIQSWRGDYNRV